MESTPIKIFQKGNHKTALRIIPGHFATNHSHINYYIDITTLKIRQSEAKEIAKTIALEYVHNTMVDTIVCMDGCEVIGAFLSEELTNSGIMCLNSHKTLYIVTPEINVSNQLIFQDNLQLAIRNKHIILLLASATTGKTVHRSLECINYYGGIVQGISAIFSAVNSIDGIPVHSIFKASDISDYQTYQSDQCPLCKAGKKIDAIVSSNGYSKL